jgi:hypothetical protein
VPHTITHPITDFATFWAFYVGEHRKPLCRVLHYIGTATFLAATVSAIAGRSWPHLLLGIVAAYAFAWVGHFRIEGNRPATFRYPLWSLRADFKMFFWFVTGRMDREVTRLYGRPDPAPDAPLLHGA